MSGDIMAKAGVGVLALAFLVFMLFVLVVPLGIYYAWALSWIWHWTVVPVFGLRDIGVAQAWGLLLIVGVLRGPRLARPETKMEWSTTLGVLLAPLLAMLVAWILIGWY